MLWRIFVFGDVEMVFIQDRPDNFNFAVVKTTL